MKKTLLILLFMIINVFAVFSMKNVLILHSYQSDYKWTNSVQEGILEVIGGEELNYYVEYMDAKKFSGDEFEMSLAEYFKNKYASKDIQYIIMSDDRALAFLFKYRNEVFGNIPVFFCGINQFVRSDFEGRQNYFGIIEDIDFHKTIMLMKDMNKNLERIYVITDDYALTSKAILNAVKKEEGDHPELEFIYQKEFTIGEIVNMVSKKDENAAVYLGTFVLDNVQRYYFTDEILKIVSDYSKMPVYISWSFFLNGGNILGGIIINGKTQGQLIAGMFLDYLSGKQVGISEDSMKEYVIDYSVMEKYGLTPPNVNEKIVYINKKDTAYTVLITIIWIGSAVIALILSMFIYTKLKLNGKVKRLRLLEKKNREIQNIIDGVPEKIFAKDREGRFIFANKMTADFFSTDTESIKGKKCNELRNMSDYEFFCMKEEEKKVFETNEKSVIEETFSSEDNVKYYKTTRIPFSFGDESINAILGIAVDVTELQNKNEELLASYEEMQAMNEDLKVLYDENEGLLLKMEKLTSFSLNKYEKPEELFEGFFTQLKQLIPEVGDYFFLESRKDQLVFKNIGGTALDGFNAKITGDLFAKIVDVNIYSDFYRLGMFCENEEEEIYFKNIFSEVEQSLVIPVKTKNMNYGFYILNLNRSNDSFSQESLRLAWFFSSIIHLYLMINEHRDELFESYVRFSKKLAVIAEAYDEDTGNHIDRVGELSAYIAEKMDLPNQKVNEIRSFAPLHDIGKIFIPKEILLKEGPLDEKEWEEMKKHTSYACRLLGDDDKFETALNIALYHHEKHDGTGYPSGKRGSEIPLEAAIVSIIDVYDALRSKRPYKKAFTHEEAVDIIINGTERTRPSHFNPEVYKVFKENHLEIYRLWEEYKAIEFKNY